MTSTLTFAEYVAKLRTLSPAVDQALEGLVPGRHPEDALLDWYKETEVHNHKAVCQQHLYDPAIPVSVRTMMLVYLMEPVPWYIKERNIYPGSWEQNFPHEIDYDKLERPLQALALELMLLWPPITHQTGYKANNFSLPTKVTGADAIQKCLFAYLIKPLLWAIDHSDGERRSAYIGLLPWLPWDVQSYELLYPGMLTLLERPQIPFKDYESFDRQIRKTLKAFYAQELKDAELERLPEGRSINTIYHRCYIYSLMRTWVELPDERLMDLLGEAGNHGLTLMCDQLLVGTHVPWGEERRHEICPKYVLACLGKLDRLTQLLEERGNNQPRLYFQTWRTHDGLFSGIVRDLVQRLLTFPPDSASLVAELTSEDARRGIRLVVSGEVTTIPETRLLLQYLPQIRPDLVVVPASVG